MQKFCADWKWKESCTWENFDPVGKGFYFALEKGSTDLLVVVTVRISRNGSYSGQGKILIVTKNIIKLRFKTTNMQVKQV